MLELGVIEFSHFVYFSSNIAVGPEHFLIFLAMPPAKQHGNVFYCLQRNHRGLESDNYGFKFHIFNFVT